MGLVSTMCREGAEIANSLLNVQPSSMFIGLHWNSVSYTGSLLKVLLLAGGKLLNEAFYYFFLQSFWNFFRVSLKQIKLES